MRHHLLLAAGLLLGTTPFVPQDAAAPRPAASAPASRPADPKDVATPEALVAALYDVISGAAGHKRDWDRMRSLFRPDARLMPMVKGRDGAMRTVTITVEDYVQRSGPMLERDGFFEHEIARRLERFGDFAHCWSTYESRRSKDDPTPFMRGINSIQLVRMQDRWWVQHILWEQEHDAGPIPPQYLPAK